jgi:hypothetical protein
MARFVRNPDGAVHSVPDDFEFPADADGNVIGEWEDVEESEASPQLLGTEADPVVEAVRLHTLAESPVHEVVSSGHVGDDPEPSEAPADETETAAENDEEGTA